ncbi:hypothetical protein DFH06DRAFT_1351807 [Mycena polygramma]|nr:hypothetical protein DFH06DRAFT_1351807 [Mycena polygramma]
MSSPPPYSAVDLDRLVSDFTRLGLNPGSRDVPRPDPPRPLTPPRAPTPSPETLYRWESPAAHGSTEHWDEAAYHTQGVPGARATLVTPKLKHCRPKTKNRGYAVFFGKVPGSYKTWEEVRPLVERVPGCLHQSYPSKDASDAAFEYARARSWTRVCTSRHLSSPQVPPPAIPVLPQPADFLDTPNPLHTGSDGPAAPGHRWYVVYRGVCPGVYQSSLECGLNTSCVPGAVHDSWTTKEKAIEKFQIGLADNRVGVLCPAYRV